MAKTFGLGRGLDALIPRAAQGSEVPEIPVERISRNPHQPRNHFDEADTAELAASIEAPRCAPADRGANDRRRRL